MEKMQRPLVPSKSENRAALEQPVVLGVYVGVILMVQIVLATLYFQHGWHFAASGFVMLLPLYFLYFLLAYWMFGNEMRGAEQVRSILGGKRGERVDMCVLEVVAMQGNNRIWAAKLVFGTLPVVVMANLRWDLTRYTISVWAVGGVALFVVGIFTLEGAARGKLWWHDALSDYFQRLREEAGEDDDLESSDRL